jgi:hypothetical protein
MAINIQSTLDMELDSVKCVVYGGAGVGKTRLCATAPTPLIISAEEGLLSLAEVACDYIEIKSLRELDEAYKFARSDQKYETICLDSLSEICEVLLQECLPNHKDPRQAYNEMAAATMPLLRNFRRLKGKNTVFTSKLIQVQDETSLEITQQLFIPGKVIPNQVPYMVDELFCMQVDRKGKPYLQTQPDRVRFCKDRSGALDAHEYGTDGQIPNMTTLFTKIMDKRKQAHGTIT